MYKIKVTLILSVLILFTINSAEASIISCDSDYTIMWNEELQQKECTLNGESVSEQQQEQKKKKSDSKPFNMEGFSFDESTDSRKHPTWVQKVIPIIIENDIDVLQQKIDNDMNQPINTRNNYFFNDNIRQSELKAMNTFNEKFGNFTNPDYLTINEPIEIDDTRTDRSDPEFLKEIKAEEARAKLEFEVKFGVDSFDNWNDLEICTTTVSAYTSYCIR